MYPENWFKDWELKNNKEFVLRKLLLEIVSVNNVCSEMIVSMVQKQLENREGFKEIPKIQIRLMLLRLVKHYGYVGMENGTFFLTEFGKEVLKSPFILNEKFAGNYISDLIINTFSPDCTHSEV